MAESDAAPVDAAALNFAPTLDVAAAARAFRERGRVRIADALDAVSAARLHACLVHQVPWRLVYNEGMRQVVVDEHELERRDVAFQREILQQVLARAQDQFQYLYRSFPMVTAYLNGEYPELFLHRVFEWLNQPETLDVLRRVTGIDSLRKADAQATLYKPGHFLTAHDDSGREHEKRRVAYVLNMTKRWLPEWGGQLQFLAAKEGGVDEVWPPAFNTLALFRVPTWHTVTYVAPFANAPRLAITGWLCDL
jgi:SM-20-related protein